MKGVQAKIDCQKSASNTLVVDFALYKITLHYITLKHYIDRYTTVTNKELST